MAFMFQIFYANDKMVGMCDGFFKFFDQFENLEKFLSTHQDITEIFSDDFTSRKYKVICKNDPFWYKKLLTHKLNAKARVAIPYKDNLYHFSVTIVSGINENQYTVFFKDICKTIQKEKLIVKNFWCQKNKNDQLHKLLNHRDKLSLMGEMMENVIHQWKQPLSSITFLASSIQFNHELQILNDRLLLTTVEDIIKNTQYMNQTIYDFKEFLSHPNPRKVLKINEVIQKARSILQANLHRAGVELILDIQDECYTQGFENQFIQALINLINNAVDALKSQVPYNRKIFITLYVQDDTNILTIEDTAQGIPLEYIDQIFEQYFSTKGEKGTGIGLFVTKQIIQKYHGGEIFVENTQNGAKFTITTSVYEFEEIEKLEIS